MTSPILELIEQYSIITIFRHEMPDGDALGSQFGLASWLKRTFPDKHIYRVGWIDEDNRQIFGATDPVDDATIKRSLAIVLDTANQPRIDDKRYVTAEKLIKIDHHIEVDEFGNLSYVNNTKSSTCELVADLIAGHQALSTLDPETAAYLYMGILTDTLRFSTTNTNANTLATASQLVATGIDPAALSYRMFNTSRAYFQLANEVRSRTVFINDELAYARVSKEQIERYGVGYVKAKDLVNEFNALAGLLAWVLFIEDEQGSGRYNVSLRSRQPAVNDIAAQFGGGGHRHAAGIKGLDDDQMQKLLELLITRIAESKR